MNEETASKESLADYLAHLLVKDRNYDDLIQMIYRDLLIETFEAYKDKVYDAQKLQVLCYEEGLSSELYLYTGKALLDYCGEDLAKLAMIYHEEYNDIHYEGTLEELPEEVQLFIRLN